MNQTGVSGYALEDGAKLRQIRALLLPVDQRLECRVLMLPAEGSEIDRRAAGLLIGGDVQAAYHWRLYGRGVAPRSCRVYLDGDRVMRRLPGNERVATLGARLGRVDRTMTLLGSALVIGTGLGGGDIEVPHAVVFAAWRSGLLQSITSGIPLSRDASPGDDLSPGPTHGSRRGLNHE